MKSRANALKHGLTGSGVVLPEVDAAEVERRTASFTREAGATGEIGLALARRAALNSVRMERGADQQAAALTARVRKVAAEFTPPEGVEGEEAEALRLEACREAMFDPSKEAALARQYEAAAERAFLRCLKELERHSEAEVEAAPDLTSQEFEAMVGSFSRKSKKEEEIDALYDQLNIRRPPTPERSPRPVGSRIEIDLPIAIGQPR